jgi:methionine-rich copper-binding protein CopC
MKVYELIEQLKEMPQNIEIKMYNTLRENYSDIQVFKSSIMQFAEIEPDE